MGLQSLLKPDRRSEDDDEEKGSKLDSIPIISNLKQFFDSIIGKHPGDDFDQLLKKGNDAWSSGNLRKAMKYFNWAIETNAEDERPWNNKGIVYRSIGNSVEARKCFRNALKINPNNAIIKRNLESLDKKQPATSSSLMFSIGYPKSTTNLVPMLKYEIPQVMVTAVVIVSAFLFLTIYLMFKTSPIVWEENFQYLALALTGVSFLFIMLSLISQIHYLLPIIEYEINIFLIYMAGVIFIVLVPVHESLGYASTEEILSTGNIALFIMGSVFVVYAIIKFYIKGGYFLPWLSGVIIFMITAFHESFRFIVFTNTFGTLDQAMARIGIILTFIGVSLFLSRKIVNALLIRSETLRSEGEFQRAMRILDIIIKINPYNEVAWNDKGNILYNLGEIDEAKKCYTHALELDDSYDIAHQNLSMVMHSASTGH